MTDRDHAEETTALDSTEKAAAPAGEVAPPGRYGTTLTREPTLTRE